MSTVASATRVPVHHHAEVSERTKAERRLGVLLSAPAVIVLIAVAGYPILQAAYQSLFSYRLTAPDAREFVGLQNYVTILTDSLWWTDFGTTMGITVITVAVEFVIGFSFALVMHRLVFGRGLVRTAILIPYAVITVVSAYAWQYAFASDSGFVNSWLGITKDWFGERGSALSVICLSEIWKTTPFISLLLLAGLAQIPERLQDAAKVDGATWWQRFRLGDAAQHAGRHHGGDPLPRRRRVPHLRQRLHHDRRRRGHRVALDPRVPPDGQPDGDRARIRRLGPALPERAADLPDLHQGPAHSRRAGERRMRSSRRSQIGLGIGSLAIVVWSLAPIVWIVSLSLKEGDDINNQKFWPTHAGLDNYDTVFSTDLFTSALRNSLGIVSIATVLSVVIATCAAYAISRLEFPGRQMVLNFALAVSVFPAVSIATPLFTVWRDIGLYDTWLGLIIPYMSLTLPVSLWMLSSYFKEIPRSLEQAAQVDGASTWQTMWKVMVPLAAPGVFTTAIIAFLTAWNDFVFGITLTSTEAARPVPAALAFFSGDSQFAQPTAAIAAASVVVTIPVVIVVLLFQRRIVAGLTGGAVKG